VLAALDALRELDLLGRREERHLADVLEEELERVGRDLRLGLGFRLGLVGICVDDGDLGLVQRGVEIVELRRLELELVEGERELVRVDLSRPVPALEQPLALVAGEDLLDRRSSGSALRFFGGQTAPLPRRRSQGSCGSGGRQSNEPLGQVGPGPATSDADTRARRRRTRRCQPRARRIVSR
jgi:hypothetical protein